MIYGVAWNKIHVANLTTRQVLTADKSLIEEGAEQHHFDYFFGGLTISPNGKKFLSAGWIWGSYDACAIYDIEDFIFIIVSNIAL